MRSSVQHHGKTNGVEKCHGKALTDAIVRFAHGLGARNASKEVILLLPMAEARGAGNHGHRGLGGHVLPEHRRTLLTRNANHTGLNSGPENIAQALKEQCVRGWQGCLGLSPVM